MPLWRRRREEPGLPAVTQTPAGPVRLRVHAAARRFTLRPDRDGEGAVLTLPPGVGRAAVERFLADHADWLTQALARRPTALVPRPGLRLPVDGRERLIATEPGLRSAVRLEDDRLLLRPGIAAGPTLAAWLRLRARAQLVPLAEAHARALGRPIAGIAFRDTRSRWGSCSAAGRLSFSWRLAMAPPRVQDYLAAHEVAHLAEMNHSPRFWAVLARLMPDHAAPQAWLRREGRQLHRYRFDAEG